jgi:hypothetical protein
MAAILKVVNVEGLGLIEASDNETTDREELCRCRSRVLALRSCISAITSVAASLSSYFHPYIPDTLAACLPLLHCNGIPDTSSLAHDVERCLEVLASDIPARLCIPAVLQAAPTLYAKGHLTALSFASFQKTLWIALDRPTVEGHMVSLQALVTAGLNYRYSYGDQSQDTGDVDDEVCNACVELCLKFTEVELREYVIRLLEWAGKGVVVDDNAWKQYARSTILFRLMSALVSKLRSIFVPVLGLVWTYAADCVGTFVEASTSNTTEDDSDDEEGTSSKKKSKKRKRALKDRALLDSHGGVTEDRSVGRELMNATEWILDAVRLCCVHDSVKFIDQVRNPIVRGV